MPAASSTETERHARPLPDGGPAFLAGVSRDLRPRRELLQLGERERSRRGDAALDRQPPVGERSALQLAVGVAERRLSLTPGLVVPVAGNEVMSFWLYSLTSDCRGSSARWAAYVKVSPMRSRLP